MPVTLQILGSGDAFASGGRFHTCFLLRSTDGQVLVDCGATSMVPLRRTGVALENIDAVLLSHLHGDHFGGVPFLLLDARFNTPRQRPLVVAGPPSVEARVMSTLDLLFPGSRAEVLAKVPVRFVEWSDGVQTPVGPVLVTPLPVVHPSGAASYGLRVRAGSRTVAYSGDTQWTDALVDLSRGTDVFICECYRFDKDVPYHLSFRILRDKVPLLATRRLVLTHMSDDMLAQARDLDVECAADGDVLEI
jgi:ribonuclease BN (tRNA processing enzyme)